LPRAKQRRANNQKNDNMLTVGSAAGGLRLAAGFFNEIITARPMISVASPSMLYSLEKTTFASGSVSLIFTCIGCCRDEVLILNTDFYAVLSRQ
jgi:hypothetical protein